MAGQFGRVAIVGIGLKGGSIVHVLACYRLKLKELSEVLQGGSLQDLQNLL